MEDDFVTYEQAVKLKELGFDWKCKNYYSYEDKALKEIACINHNREKFLGICSAPKLAQAAKWLREAKNIHVVPVLENVNKADYCCHITQLHKSVKRIIDGDKYFESFESALSAGIDTALKIIDDESNL